MFVVINEYYKIDVFFAGQLWFDENVTKNAYLIVFILSLTFIVLPVSITLYQLGQFVEDWIENQETKDMVKPLLNTHIRKLYFLSIICGSSHSAVSLCNSNLFRLKLFDMGLTKRQKAVFDNARFWSSVLFEVCTF